MLSNKEIVELIKKEIEYHRIIDSNLFSGAQLKHAISQGVLEDLLRKIDEEKETHEEILNENGMQMATEIKMVINKYLSKEEGGIR